MVFGRATPRGSLEFVEVPVFVVKRGGDGSDRAAVSVYHEGDLYYVPQPDFGRTEARSLQTLDLVLQTVRAATHRDDLPKVPSFGVITR
jgi:hypothetical protein